MFTPKGRAFTPEEKRALLDRIYVVWLSHPSLRLGQLISCATHNPNQGIFPDIFSTEDVALVEALEEFGQKF